jgi:hypothetical protein
VINKFRTTGLVLDKKIERRHKVLTEEELDDTGVRLGHLSRKSLGKLQASKLTFHLLSKNCYKIIEPSPV